MAYDRLSLVPCLDCPEAVGPRRSCFRARRILEKTITIRSNIVKIDPDNVFFNRDCRACVLGIVPGEHLRLNVKTIFCPRAVEKTAGILPNVMIFSGIC